MHQELLLYSTESAKSDPFDTKSKAHEQHTQQGWAHPVPIMRLTSSLQDIHDKVFSKLISNTYFWWYVDNT